jgi:uncharacterized damage-inducible protein DinB
MSLKREIDRLFAYGDWANREALESLRADAPPAALRRMAHILGAERTWFQRITEGPPVEVWPDLTPDACKAQVADLRRRWQGLLASLDDQGLARKVSYVNTKGRKFESTVGEILMHVALHGAYHRGQIAADVRTHGRDPAYTDYIHATREKLL